MAFVEARLLGRERLTEDLAIFRFDNSGSKVEFIPGQYNTLRVKTDRIEKPIARPLSIASAPHEPAIEYFVRWVRSGGRGRGGNGLDGLGAMTTELFELSDEELRKVEFSVTDVGKGKLYLDDGDDRNVIMVGTGTGLAPFISQLRTAGLGGRELSRYTLIHGVAHCDDLAYQDELAKYSGERGMTFLHVQSRTRCDANSEINYVGGLFFNRDPSRKGRINHDEVSDAIESGRLENSPVEQALRRELSPERDTVLLCGNPDMINNVTRLLEARDFIDGKDVLSEKYWAAKKETFKT